VIGFVVTGVYSSTRIFLLNLIFFFCRNKYAFPKELLSDSYKIKPSAPMLKSANLVHVDTESWRIYKNFQAHNALNTAVEGEEVTAVN
jgi:hypothetical protein